MQIIKRQRHERNGGQLHFQKPRSDIGAEEVGIEENLKCTRRDHGEDREREGRPSEAYGVGWIVNSPVERSVMV